MISLNDDVLCVIDTETTGLKAGFHDIIEMACVPLDARLEPMQDVMYFDCLIKPRRPQNIDPEAMKVNKITEAELELHGLDVWKAADLFVQWFNNLNLVPGKKIQVLAKNWPFDRGFIVDWLEPKTFDSMFHYRVREVSAVVNYINDRYEFAGQKHPFPNTSLAQVKKQLNIPNDRDHRALADALATAEVYRRLMRFDIP